MKKPTGKSSRATTVTILRFGLRRSNCKLFESVVSHHSKYNWPQKNPSPRFKNPGDCEPQAPDKSALHYALKWLRYPQSHKFNFVKRSFGRKTFTIVKWKVMSPRSSYYAAILHVTKNTNKQNKKPGIRAVRFVLGCHYVILDSWELICCPPPWR